MTIAIGGIFHESNSFATSVTTLDDFRSVSYDTGDDIIERWVGTNSEIAGFLAAAERQGWKVVPTLMAWGMPSGRLADAALRTTCDELCRRIRAIPNLTGILLVTHGAMVTESDTDPDGWWLSCVRKAVGSAIPIAATVDFHGNVTPRMVEAVDVLVGYDTYPHTDFAERGEEAGELLARIVKGEIVPTPALVQVPLIPNLLTQFTDEGPMKTLMDARAAVETEPDVLTASIFGGFQWADVRHNGMSVLVVTDDDRRGARDLSRALAGTAWGLREEFVADAVTPEEAVDIVLSAPDGPNVLVDTGDNVGGGTPGDGTVLLAELLRRQAKNALVMICDPDTVRRAVEIGVRGTGRFILGGKTDPRHGEPVEAEGEVFLISDGRYVNVGPMRDGIRDDMGRTVVIRCEGAVVVATERKMPMWNLQQLRSLGIEPTRLHTIAVKAAIAHRAAYGPIAHRMINVGTPGVTALDIRRFTYSQLKRPVFPLDADAAFL